MKTELRRVLRTLKAVDFNELGKVLNIASMAREYIEHARIDIEEFEKRMKLDKDKGVDYLCGAYCYTMSDIAMLETLRYELYKKEADEVANREAQVITTVSAAKKNELA